MKRAVHPAFVPALFSVLLSCSPSVRAAKERAPTPVHAVEARTITPEFGERYPASLMPQRQIVFSFRVGGFVEAIYGDSAGHRLETGDWIPAGVTLASLRPREYDLPVQQAKGQLDAGQRAIEAARQSVAEAEAAKVKADAAWQRADGLYASRALTAPEWEAAKAQHDIAAAQLASARSRLESATAQQTATAAVLSSAQLARTDTSIVTPWSGQLLQRSVEIGTLTTPGSPAFALADVSSLRAVFGVPDTTAVSLRKGGRAPLSVEAVPREFTGSIVSIATAADPATRLFQIEAVVPNANSLLKPGMVATVHLRSGGAPQPVTVVPLGAIIRARGESSGFSVMVVRMNRARSQPVSVGAAFGAEIAVSGVQPGELVISEGATLLAEGERVEVIR
jgi:multidrug efflux pump subunit AcrA (membrane-fusion protein)